MPFVKGQSGNPLGRPRGDRRAIASLALAAREHCAVALKTLVEICKRGETHSVRVQAAIALLDRGYGRPTQSVELSAEVQLTQLNMFADLAPAEQALLHDALLRVEHDGGDDEGGSESDVIELEQDSSGAYSHEAASA